MIGTAIGQYRVIETIGDGGMGEVFRATDLRLQRAVAIKSLPPHFAADPERVARFEREAQALAAVAHPGIVGIYELLEHEGQRFLVLELVEGETTTMTLSSGMTNGVSVPSGLTRVSSFNHGLGSQVAPDVMSVTRSLGLTAGPGHGRSWFQEQSARLSSPVRRSPVLFVFSALSSSGSRGFAKPMRRGFRKKSAARALLAVTMCRFCSTTRQRQLRGRSGRQWHAKTRNCAGVAFACDCE